jgi:hypothetical protein
MRSSVLRRSIRQTLPKRDRWHSLQEYAVGEANAKEFGALRSRDAQVAATIAGAASPKTIDWAAWEGRISNKEVVQCLKDFHSQQATLLDAVIVEDHATAVKGQTAGWELFTDAIKSCEKSVEKSEDIMKNGARALWISFHNPPISMVSQSEWLDADQYWQAFVEKHHFYHNHLCSAIEDPESKEYDEKQKADLKKRWAAFDGKGTSRQNNKLLYQRPSWEYYELYRGPFLEHMLFYLSKTGGDARFFPQNMPVQWFAEIYNIRFDVFSILHRRKKLIHESTLARTCTMDFNPANLEKDGEGYYAKLIAQESAATELTVARLMGNFIFLSDSHIPVQTGKALYWAVQTDDGNGTFFSLGGDVNCLFYKPSEALSTPDPVECFNSLADYVTMSGRRFEPGYAQASQAFCEVLSSRKAGLGGVWFNAPAESSKDAFMRRLTKSDPSYAIFEAYAAEHSERWAAAKAMTLAEAMEAMPEIERKYALECAAFDDVVFGLSDEFSTNSKVAVEQIVKMSEEGQLQAAVDSGAYVGVIDGAAVGASDLAASVESFDTARDKGVEVVLATKIPALEKKK